MKRFLCFLVCFLVIAICYRLIVCRENNATEDMPLGDATIKKIDNSRIAIIMDGVWSGKIVFLTIDDQILSITHFDEKTIHQYPNHGVYYYCELDSAGLKYSQCHHLIRDAKKDLLYGGLGASYYDYDGDGMPEYKMEKGKYYKLSCVKWHQCETSDIIGNRSSIRQTDYDTK